MALHSDIRVNREVIATWQARRTTVLVDGGEHVYECQVDWLVHPRQRSTFTLSHAYSDGATALAAAVLARAAQDAPPAPDPAHLIGARR